MACAKINFILPSPLFYLSLSLSFCHSFISVSTVPDSAKPSPTPPPPTNPSVPSASSSTGGNGKRTPSGNQQQQPAAPRYPPREVPPRFRQHEHKQLLKRGQPLPTGSTALVQPVSANPSSQPFSCQTHPGQPRLHDVHRVACWVRVQPKKHLTPIVGGLFCGFVM